MRKTYRNIDESFINDFITIYYIIILVINYISPNGKGMHNLKRKHISIIYKHIERSSSLHRLIFQFEPAATILFMHAESVTHIQVAT